MNKQIVVAASCMLVLAMVVVTSSCASQPSEQPPTDPSLSGSPESSNASTHVIRRAENEAAYSNHGITTTKVELKPGESGIVASGLMVRLTLDDLVEESDAVVIGKVIDIFPSRQVDWEPWDQMIITDVVIEVERYLYGQSQSPYIAIVVRGGQVRETAMWVEDEPVFNLGEEVALFLDQMKSDITPLEGFESAEYYRVTGSMQGKLGYRDGTMVTMEGSSVTLSEIEQKIASIHGGE